ncbi:MAG TPA: tetratricopeptide repeat protein [Gemmataceae bacterium]|nr:tetratricopeptide repeat protein [Gemmataceae bacterium]
MNLTPQIQTLRRLLESTRARTDVSLSLEDCESLEALTQLLEKHEETLVALVDRPDSSPQSLVSESVEGLTRLGMQQSRRGEYQKAFGLFTAALKLAPQDAHLHALRGDTCRLLCDNERALADFEAALAIAPNASFLLGRAQVYRQCGAPDQAIADCTSALEMDPNLAEAYRLRAAAHGDMECLDLALADWTEAINQAPGDHDSYYQRGLISIKQKDFAQAIADFDRVVQQNPYHVQAFLQRGQCRRWCGDHVQAILDFTEVLRQHPQHVVAYNGRGLAYKLSGDKDRAIADFTKALLLDPDNAQAYHHRGVLYRARGELVLAQADLDEAVKRQPDNWAALYYRSKIFLAQGQFPLALIDLTAVLVLHPRLVVAYLSRALAYDQLGRWEEAIADGALAIKLDPESPAAYLVRGVVHAHAGQFTQAIDDLNEAVRLDERFALAYQERAVAHTLNGEYDRALADCDQLIALEPANAQAFVNRSIVYHFKGEVQRALTDYSRALQLDPRSIMSGWNQNLSQAARGQAIGRIANYIDGLRDEPASAEPPPPSSYQIVIKQPASNGADPAEKRVSPRVQDKPSAELPVPSRDSSETSLRISEKTSVAAPSLAKRSSITKGRRRDLEPLKNKSRQQESSTAASALEEKPSEKPASPAVSSEPKLDAESKAVEDAIDELLVDANSARVKEPAGRPELKFPNPLVVTCPNCREQTIPTENLLGGRVRCGKCHSVFQPSSAPLKMKTQPARNTQSFWVKWKKPMAGVAAAIVLVYLLLPAGLFGKSDRVEVFPVQGKADLDGKPIPEASIFLHPVGVKNPAFPRPRGIVQADGTFVLGTYRKDDGAPPGEYKVSVQLLKQTAGQLLPKNHLPVQYADAETSSLTIHIEQGENQGLLLKLKH